MIDTERKCIDITRTELFWQEWTVTKMEAQAIALSFMNLSVSGDDAELHEEERETRIMLKERDELTIVLHDTVRGGELSLMGEVNSIGEEGVVVRVQAKDSTGTTQLIQQAHLLRIAERIDLPLKEGYSDYVVTVSGVIDLTLFDWRYIGGSFVERQTILTVCDDSGDRYRYGFNGQEKVNEISGLGNHNTAEYWEYDTRLGRRWNIDPVYKYNLSNYSVLSNNPIIMIDPNGDDDCYNKKGKYVGSDGKGSNIRLVDHEELQDEVKFNEFMNASIKGEVDIENMREGISREITFKNDGPKYKQMYEDSKDNAERSTEIVLDIEKAEVRTLSVKTGRKGEDAVSTFHTGTILGNAIILANIHTHRQEEEYLKQGHSDQAIFEDQYREAYSDGQRAKEYKNNYYSIGMYGVDYYSPDGKKSSKNNLGTRKNLESGKFNIGKHALEQYGKQEKGK